MHDTVTGRTLTDIYVKQFFQPIPHGKTGKRIFPVWTPGKPPDLLKTLLLAGIGQITSITYAAEVFGQDMHQETANELFARQGQGLFLPFVPVILPAEHDLLFINGEDTAV